MDRLDGAGGGRAAEAAARKYLAWLVRAADAPGT